MPKPNEKYTFQNNKFSSLYKNHKKIFINETLKNSADRDWSFDVRASAALSSAPFSSRPLLCWHWHYSLVIVVVVVHPTILATFFVISFAMPTVPLRYGCTVPRQHIHMVLFQVAPQRVGRFPWRIGPSPVGTVPTFDHIRAELIKLLVVNSLNGQIFSRMFLKTSKL